MILFFFPFRWVILMCSVLVVAVAVVVISDFDGKSRRHAVFDYLD